MAKFLLNARPLSTKRSHKVRVKLTGAKKKFTYNDLQNALEDDYASIVGTPLWHYRVKSVEVELKDGQGQLIVGVFGRDVLITERSTGIDGIVVAGQGIYTQWVANGTYSSNPFDTQPIFEVADATDDGKLKYVWVNVESIYNNIEKHKVD